MTPLTQNELDPMADEPCCCGCGKPYSEDNPLSLAARCHFPSQLKVEYWKGVLTLRCAECGAAVCTIAVAK